MSWLPDKGRKMGFQEARRARRPVPDRQAEPVLCIPAGALGPQQPASLSAAQTQGQATAGGSRGAGLWGMSSHAIWGLRPIAQRGPCHEHPAIQPALQPFLEAPRSPRRLLRPCALCSSSPSHAPWPGQHPPFKKMVFSTIWLPVSWAGKMNRFFPSFIKKQVFSPSV